jgi:hypothetical protein
MMTSGFHLLAQVYREDLGRGFRSATSQLRLTDVIPYAVAFALLVFAAWLAPYLRRRNDMSERCDDPQKLFRELSLVHQLDRSSRQLLWRLAEENRFAQPAQVFVTPTVFEPAHLPESLRGQLEDVKQLRSRLF